MSSEGFGGRGVGGGERGLGWLSHPCVQVLHFTRAGGICIYADDHTIYGVADDRDTPRLAPYIGATNGAGSRVPE